MSSFSQSLGAVSIFVVVPECFDEVVQIAVAGGDVQIVSDDVIGGDTHYAPGDGVFAPCG